MNQVISFSGGRTSAYMTLEVLKIHPDAEVIFMDTGAEHPATYDFIRMFSTMFGVNITCIRCAPSEKYRGVPSYEIIPISDIKHDLEGWKRILAKYGSPYIGGAFCTDRMKLVPFTKYCNDKFGKGNYHRWIGIRADEPRRLSRKDGYSYLADISDSEKSDIIEFWSKQAFDLEIEEHLGNCVFCIKKSVLKIAAACKEEPELAKNFISVVDEFDKKDDHRMYRGKMELGDIIALFSGEGLEDVKSRIKSTRSLDTGSCSESCEIFTSEGTV